MTEEINVTFIIPKDCRSENECSEEMQLAFLTCEQHAGSGLQAKWVHESQWKKFDGLTKRDVFVLSEFEGELYDKLHSTKCLLVGPRCMSCCLTEGTSIPSGPEPVYTIAMRGLVVTASGLSKEQKETIKKKVFWMGGIYSTLLTDDTTHLISDTVTSVKYVKAVEKGIPVMSITWIEAVWETSLRLNVNGSSSEFLNHRLPPFMNLQVTTSGISKKEKQKIMKLVGEHGGVFSGAFQSETTDVVVLTKDGIGSEKYKAALEYGKAVVLPSWIEQSAAKGIALPFAKFKVVGASTSSPLAGSRLPDMSLNFSRITNARPPSNFVDETRSADVTMMSQKAKSSQDLKKSDVSIDKEVITAFENLDMSLIKKAGPIFDGFCIWVTGLEGVSRERAAACVSRCGGVRYDAPHPRVTHVVAANTAARSAARAAPAARLLTPLWLVRCVEQGRALDETQFLIDMKPCTPAKSAERKQTVDAASPMSKRNLALLRRDLPPPPLLTTSEEAEPQDELVNQYLSQNLPEPEREKTPERAADVTSHQQAPDITEDMNDDVTEEVEQIFRGMKIEVQGLDETAVAELGAEVSAAGGSLAGAGAGGSHAIVPLDFAPHELVNSSAEPVTVFWLKDCLSSGELVDIQYYHRPVQLSGEPVLRGVVASLSTYSGVERAFLDELAKLLGATTQLRFCRRNTANALASTHLICPTASGDKYMGALKWGLPAVRASWLLACAKEGVRVSEKEHLVGDTRAPPSPPPPLQPEEQANEETNTTTDKENAVVPPVATTVGNTSNSREQTPNNKKNEGDTEMSPASRYIAMARQGLLGSQETPKQDEGKGHGGEGAMDGLDDALSTPNLRSFSPTTQRRLQALRRGDPPSAKLRTPNDPFDKHPATPDSAFGAALRPGGRLSPDARKRLWSFVEQLPTKQPEPVRDKHTPLSEIRNRFLAQFNKDVSTPPTDHVVAPRKLQLLQDQADTPPAKVQKLSQAQSPSTYNITEPDTPKSVSSASNTLPAAVDVQLQRLNAALTSRLSSQRARRTREPSLVPTPAPDSEPAPESQPNTVGWDDTTPAPQRPAEETKRFMLSSNVDNREEIMTMITNLGGTVSEGAELDPEATHLLCCAPGRSEKMLGSVAAGRWVLHPLYVVKSQAAGQFLNEEEYEWGNPLATSLPALSGAERILARAAYRWRSNRAAGASGPFTGMVALLHVPPPRRRLLARLVTAGDGLAPELEPPYTDDSITVCFADVKRYPLSQRDSAWLVARRVPVCAPVLLSAFLTDEPPPVPSDHCLPDYKP